MNITIIEIGNLQYKLLNGTGPTQSTAYISQLNQQISINIGLNISTSYIHENVQINKIERETNKTRNNKSKPEINMDTIFYILSHSCNIESLPGISVVKMVMI